MKRILHLVSFLVLISSFHAVAEPMKKVAPAPTEVEYGDSRFYRYKLNTTFGVTILRNSGIQMGGEFGVAPWSSTPFYIGPEVNFTLFSPGSVLGTFLGFWYDLKIYGAPRLRLELGGLLGVAFASNMDPGIPQTSLGAFFDGCIAQDIDENVSVRGQFRPGMMAGSFAFMMNFNVSFRFL